MKRIRQKLGCLLAGAALLALAACGQPSRAPSPSSSQAAPTPGGVSSAAPTPSRPETAAPAGKALVVYCSATGNTAAVAGSIADALNADAFELVPTEPYTAEDLNWSKEESRVAREHEDESLRTVELTTTTVERWDEYDTVFLGYPIWWGVAAWPVDGFVAANDFTGKTVVPFCTSSSSGLGESGTLLAERAGTGDWQEGRRFSCGVSASDAADWVNGLELGA